jgi:hypothetical protein
MASAPPRALYPPPPINTNLKRQYHEITPFSIFVVFDTNILLKGFVVKFQHSFLFLSLNLPAIQKIFDELSHWTLRKTESNLLMS